jgi:hypothetical protein
LNLQKIKGKAQFIPIQQVITSFLCLKKIATDAMIDSPATFLPLDPREQPILDELLHSRDALLLLKQDKSTYIKSHDVLPLYERVVEQVQKVNNIRAGRKQEQHNRGWMDRLVWHREATKLMKYASQLTTYLTTVSN